MTATQTVRRKDALTVLLVTVLATTVKLSVMHKNASITMTATAPQTE